MIHYKLVPYGFEYGPAIVTRISSDDKKGWVVISVETPKQSIQVYVTKTGKVRVHDSRGGEWEKPPAVIG
jgi:hypothetical protein